ncbi:MAG: RNA-binding S4 domain-containing protein [Bacteroidales bacterium]|nr:RNA-binding S4 domain-containing protein [Bacteroidales bacterium]MDY0217639.1 RNA-binding S4 domain-containing protein [Bacteroidales bacterium]
MEEFVLKSEFIELNKLLKLLGIAETGGHANTMISEGEVLLNDLVEYQKRKKIRPNDIIKVDVFAVKVLAAE